MRKFSNSGVPAIFRRIRPLKGLFFFIARRPITLYTNEPFPVSSPVDARRLMSYLR